MTTAETTSYRYHRRMMWQVVRARYVEAVAGAMEAGVPEAEARQQAARSVRGDLRALMSELLTHAPTAALVAFLEAAQQWGESGERLLEQGDVVLALVDSVEPGASGAGPGALDATAAEDDARWQAWAEAWVGALRVAAPAVGDQPPAGGEPPSQSSSSPRRWVPWALSAAAVVGTTVVVVLANRERTESEGRDGRMQ